MSARPGGHVVADALTLHGTRFVFTVPGNSVLGTLDGLRDRDDVRVVVCRHEGGAAFMAEAHGRLTGEPGVCLVTRGPGATNASIGVVTASEEGTPLVLLVGDVSSAAVGRGAFQEIDTLSMFQPIAKWVARVPSADRIPELLSRAFHTATSGRPGPVVLVLPEDVQLDATDVALGTRYQRAEPKVSPSDLDSVRDRLANAKTPMMILGGRGWTKGACADIARFAERFALPVAVTFRRQDAIDNDHPHYVGTLGVGTDPVLAERVHDADVLVVVGGELGEVETAGYRLLDIPRPEQQLIHVAASAETLGKIYQPDVAIVASAASFAEGAAALAPLARASDDVAAARAAFERFSISRDFGDDVNLGELVQELSHVIASDAIIAMGAGNYTHWVLRYYRYREPLTLLAPIGAPMGYSTPAAVAAGLVHPERDIVAFAGDGCFLMNGQELATAAQYGIRACFIVVNNGMLASVRMRQERLFPTRAIATDLVNPNFVTLAEAHGVPAAVLRRTGELADTYRSLRAKSDGPILIEIPTNPETLSPDQTLGEIRAEP